ARRRENGTMPEHTVFVKTIVTSDLAEQIAASYGVETTNVLTGFKYIGETIGRLEQAGEANRYICGFEESYGYLTGTYVRDKDAVDGTFMICEMYAYYRKRGISLTQKLAEIYAKYGYCLNTLHSYTFGGQAGFRHMQSIMARLRGGIGSVCGVPVTEMLDYAQGIDGLPKSDVLKFRLENGSSFVVRPSGTEPKLKVYAMIRMPGRAQAAAFEQLAVKELEQIIK
ncbi:MAG: phospho-sugar mutase, partial [Solobacterium sp.]|nr:phospho-sugar mutase [Solobacterium sp.]